MMPEAEPLNRRHDEKAQVWFAEVNAALWHTGGGEVNAQSPLWQQSVEEKRSEVTELQRGQIICRYVSEKPTKVKKIQFDSEAAGNSQWITTMQLLIHGSVVCSFVLLSQFTCELGLMTVRSGTSQKPRKTKLIQTQWKRFCCIKSWVSHLQLNNQGFIRGMGECYLSFFYYWGGFHFSSPQILIII